MSEYIFSMPHSEAQGAGDVVPQAPDFIRAREQSIKDVLPGEIVSVNHNSIVMDETTGQLVIDLNDRLNATSSLLSRHRRSIPVFRLYKELEGKLFDGFIADLRGVEFIEKRDMGLGEWGTASEEFGEAQDTYGSQLLLAAVFTGEEGELLFTGDSRLKEDAAALLEAVDNTPQPDPVTTVDAAISAQADESSRSNW
jgi:hypothetical protein